MKRRSKAKAAPPSALDVTRTLRQVLRDPRAILNAVLVRELHAESPAAVQKLLRSDSQLRSAVRAATGLITALRRLVLLLGWPSFVAANAHLLGTVATGRYARRARLSGPTLYRWRARFIRSGILGLCQAPGRGRPGRAALAEEKLLRDVVRADRAGGTYASYLLLSQHLDGKARRISQPDAQRLMGEIYTAPATKTKGRRRARRAVAARPV